MPAVAKPISFSELVIVTNAARQQISNATIDLPEYSNPAYRASCIARAVAVLQQLHARLEAEAAILKASA